VVTLRSDCVTGYPLFHPRYQLCGLANGHSRQRALISLMVRILLTVVLCLGITSAFGQQDAASVGTASRSSAAATTVGTLAVASAIAPGKYHGRSTRPTDPSRGSDFDLDLMHNPGTIQIYSAEYACQRAFPISVIGVKDGIVRLESKEGVLRGCERVFELTVSGNDLTGTLIKATRQ
jgi:hypothetical protein